ncbi:MAG TPA: acyl-CoA dehydrogenase family protein, partial [Pseudonocardiaceae bacterium]|nr:acyl-CoA dehydrogenase family protein [Pseudonocardiaceae bacterium]
MYGLSDADLSLQSTARAFTDELIPFEVEAEMNRGELPQGIVEKQRARAISLGLDATNLPTALEGRGCTTLQQVLVQEQAGRVTNALGWVMATPPGWWADVASDFQRDRWLLPTVRGEMAECYAITEADAGSDVAALSATARRDGDHYILNGEKWHVTSFNHAGYVFFQAVLTSGNHAGEHGLFVVAVPTEGMRVVRTPEYAHTISHHHPIVAFDNVRVPATHLVGGEGDGMSFSHEWFRFERLMVAARCLGAAERLVEETTGFACARKVGGEPLVTRQLVQGMLADSATELFAARSMVYETARSIDNGADRKVAHARCAMVKL